MSDFLEAVLVFGLCGFIVLGGIGAGAFVLIVLFFNKEAGEKLHIKDKSVFIEHVKGYVGLGEISIIIAVACPHRTEAYDLSRYIIEEVKKRSPIWKKEHYKDKEGEWLKGNPIQTN